MLFLIKRACTVAPQVEKAWPRPTAKALPARVPRIGAYKASFPRPIACGAGFSLWRCRVERAVRSHSLRAWAIGRAQMAIPSKEPECTLLRTIYNILLCLCRAQRTGSRCRWSQLSQKPLAVWGVWEFRCLLGRSSDSDSEPVIQRATLNPLLANLT